MNKSLNMKRIKSRNTSIERKFIKKNINLNT